MTDNNDSDIWDDDKLDRKIEAEFLETFLVGAVKKRSSAGNIGSFVLNIDASWGGGKSFFLERFKKQLDENGYMVCSINAWASDYSPDPLIPVMSAIDSSLDKLLPGGTNNSPIIKTVRENAVPLLWAFGRGAGKKIATKILAEGLDEVTDLMNGIEATTDPDDNIENVSISKGIAKSAITETVNTLDSVAKKLIDNFNGTDKSLKAFKNGLREAIVAASKNNKDKHPPFFILVDELDRCRPDYAIMLLERIKHLFEVENVVFVLATDTTQLQHSIGAVYGTGFDSQRYLHRFFDQTYTLSQPSTRGIIDQIVDKSGWEETKFPTISGDLNSDIEDIFLAFDVNSRDAFFILEMLDNIYLSLRTCELINLHYALTLIIANRDGEEINNGHLPIIGFVRGNCKISSNMKCNSYGEISMIDFLRITIEVCVADDDALDSKYNRAPGDSLEKEVCNIERQMRQQSIPKKFHTKEYARLISNCGRLSSESQQNQN